MAASLEWLSQSRSFMNTMFADLIDEVTEERRQVEAHCQSLVDAGVARWWINDAGDTELHMDGGEVYRFGDHGVTRLKWKE